MLFNIVDPVYFDKCLKSIEEAFYSLGQDNQIKSIKEASQKYSSKQINEKNLYKVFGYGEREDKDERMPYLDSYHTFFLQRKEGAEDITSIKSSKNEGNFHHFVNVVAALARLIIYFKDPANADEAFGANRDGALKLNENERELLVYKKKPDIRTFKLMLAGFYHDLGKTITDPRHPMEGAVILSCHTTEKRLMLDKIAKDYKSDFEIKRDDFLYIADLVLFHDQYGTLSTGEDGYMTLVYVIDKINRYSLNPDQEINNGGIQSHIGRCKKHIFDLWLLNVADIMVSMENKFDKQMQWRDPALATDSIFNFFRSEKGARLRHDLEITFDLLKKHTEDGKSGHCDDLTTLNIESHKWSKKHSIERLRRLVTELLRPAINDIKVMILVNYFLSSPNELPKNLELPESLKQPKNLEKLIRLNFNKFVEQYKKSKKETGSQDLTNPQNAYKLLYDIGEELLLLPEAHWNLLITRSIQSVADFDDFTTRLSWIGKMDYSLGFLREILNHALYQVSREIISAATDDEKTANDLFFKISPQEPVKRTGWIRDPKCDNLITEDPKSYCITQAVFFADNFVATMIQIFEYLLFRERAIDRLRNIEFSDTKNRLTWDKLNQLLSLEGPYRARRSIQAILQTIYLY